MKNKKIKKYPREEQGEKWLNSRHGPGHWFKVERDAVRSFPNTPRPYLRVYVFGQNVFGKCFIFSRLPSGRVFGFAFYRMFNFPAATMFDLE